MADNADFSEEKIENKLHVDRVVFNRIYYLSK